MASELVLPPIPTRLPGRPKSNRIKGVDEREEIKNQKRYGKCKCFGHNTRTCKGGPVAPKKQTTKPTAAPSEKPTISVAGPSKKPTAAYKKKKSKAKVFKPPRQNYLP